MDTSARKCLSGTIFFQEYDLISFKLSSQFECSNDCDGFARQPYLKTDKMAISKKTSLKGREIKKHFGNTFYQHLNKVVAETLEPV